MDLSEEATRSFKNENKKVFITVHEKKYSIYAINYMDKYNTMNDLQAKCKYFKLKYKFYCMSHVEAV